jgi:osmotically-inducible protein OsmY
MNLKTLLAIGLLATCAIIITACANSGHERSTGTYFDDATITTKVKSALLAEKDVNSFDISVETFNQTVQLSGFVNSQWQIDKAVQVAKTVAGVEHVKNNLVHKSKTE